MEEKKMLHAPGEVERFYRRFPAPALIGMESTGNCQWFVDLTTAIGHEVWIGDAAKIRASDPRQRKHDRRDAQLLVDLLAQGRFPRIWAPSRYKMVRLRAQAKNGLQHLAMNQGLQKKRHLWSKKRQELRLLKNKPKSFTQVRDIPQGFEAQPGFIAPRARDCQE